MRQYDLFIYLLGLGLLLVLLFLDTVLITALGLSWSFYLLLQFIHQLGQTIPLTLLLLLIAALQWIVGPWLSYTFFDDHYKYHMYVPEAEYMVLAVPALWMLALGLQWGRKYRRQYEWALMDYAQRLVTAQPALPYALILTGILFSFLGQQAPAYLSFVFFLLANTKYIGLIYLLFSRHPAKWLILLLAWVLTLLSSVQAGLFHDLLLWTVLIGLYAGYISKPSFRQKSIALLAGFVLIFLIQIIKQEYRQLIWSQQYEGDPVHLYTRLVNERIQEANIFFDRAAYADLVIRINQGWINSRVMEQVPRNEPFARGGTIHDAISAAFSLRFFNPDKKIAGGKANYERFTGFQLQRTTSMGVSLLGEGYANYGLHGAWLFLGVMGLFYGGVLHFLYRFSVAHPTILLWLPLIFLQVIKAETELAVVLNHLVKSLILVLTVFWFLSHFTRWRI